MKELTASQQKVMDVLQKEIIERYFNPAVDGDEFEILSTIRYDPCFTNVFQDLPNGEHSTHLCEIDSRLRLLDYDQSEDLFSQEHPTTCENQGLDSLFDTIRESSSSFGDYDDSLMSF